MDDNDERDELDEMFAELLQHLIDHPEDRTEEFDRFVRGLLLDPRYYQNLVERLKRDELAPQLLELLLAYARDPHPTERRAFARKALSEGWRTDDPVH